MGIPGGQRERVNTWYESRAEFSASRTEQNLLGASRLMWKGLVFTTLQTP